MQNKEIEITRDQFMSFFRSDLFNEEITSEECIEIFSTAIKGSSDFSANLLNEVLSDYGVSDIVVKKENSTQTRTRVLFSSGEGDAFISTGILEFESSEVARKYCKENTHIEGKYWTRYDIIKEGCIYEPKMSGIYNATD